MKITRWSRLWTFLSLIAIFLVTLASVSACSCGVGNAAQLPAQSGEVCSHGGESAAHSRSCCPKNHSDKTVCHCDFANSDAYVAPTSFANSVHFDAVAFLPSLSLASLKAPVFDQCDFAPDIHGPPHCLLARRFSSRAPPIR